MTMTIGPTAFAVLMFGVTADTIMPNPIAQKPVRITRTWGRIFHNAKITGLDTDVGNTYQKKEESVSLIIETDDPVDDDSENDGPNHVERDFGSELGEVKCGVAERLISPLSLNHTLLKTERLSKKK